MNEKLIEMQNRIDNLVRERERQERALRFFEKHDVQELAKRALEQCSKRRLAILKKIASTNYKAIAVAALRDERFDFGDEKK